VASLFHADFTNYSIAPVCATIDELMLQGRALCGASPPAPGAADAIGQDRTVVLARRIVKGERNHPGTVAPPRDAATRPPRLVRLHPAVVPRVPGH
jgi:hypothetical protein